MAPEAATPGPAPLTVATLNLFHYAAPGMGWHGPSRAHDADSLAAKERWLLDLLARMDADIIGFQEVVAVDRLRALCREAGYPSFAAVAEPVIDPADDQHAVPVYRRSVQAVAARGPMTATALDVRDHLARCLSLRDHWEIRRPVVRAEVETEAFGPVIVLCAHLKSPGASPDDAHIQDPAPEPGRDDAEGLSRAHAKAVIQRAAEASAVFHGAMDAVAADPDRPVFVLGDLNDTPGSPTLRALTPGSDAVGAAPTPETPDPDRYRLLDAGWLTPRAFEPAAEIPTHRHGTSVSTLDHILVSSALFPWRADARGQVIARTVHADHLHERPSAIGSDHAAVSVTVARRA